MKLAIRIVAAVVIVAVVLVGLSALYEGIYCRGYTQGIVDGFGAFIGPAPADQDFSNVLQMCNVSPNDPMETGGMLPRFYTGNLFDSLRNKLPF